MPRPVRHVARRGTKWVYCRIIQGQKVRKSLGSDFAEAKRRALLLDQQIEQQGRLDAAAPTFAFLAEKWLEDRVSMNRNERGQHLAAQRLRDHILPILGSLPLDQITPEKLTGLRRSLEAKRRRTRTGKEKRMSPQTIAHVLSDVRCLLLYAVESGRIGRSPFPSKLLPKIPEAAPKALTEEQIERFLVAAPEKYALAIRLALFTGARWGELHRLTWNAVKQVPHPHLLLERTKSGKIRRVPLCPEAISLLREERSRTSSVHVLAFRAKSPGAIVRLCQRRTGISWHWHQLRHRFACSWIERGGSLAALQAILGHASVTTTQRYARLSDQAMFEEADRVGIGHTIGHIQADAGRKA